MSMKWKTKSGEEIPISKMDNDHLLNCERLVRNRYRKQCLHDAYVCECAYPGGEPDGAAMCAEQEASYLSEEADAMEDIEERLPTYAALMKEISRRKLSVKE